MITFKRRIHNLTNEYIKKVDEIMYPLRTVRQRFLVKIKRAIERIK